MDQPFVHFIVALFAFAIDYGITTDGHTVYINAAVCDFYKRPRQKPIVFDLPNKM